jgi:hypothetical protein
MSPRSFSHYHTNQTMVVTAKMTIMLENCAVITDKTYTLFTELCFQLLLTLCMTHGIVLTLVRSLVAILAARTVGGKRNQITQYK